MIGSESSSIYQSQLSLSQIQPNMPDQKIITVASNNAELTPTQSIFIAVLLKALDTSKTIMHSNTLIHCSAGVGRSGTIAATLKISEMFKLLKVIRLTNGGRILDQIPTINIERLMTWLRFQRTSLIQTRTNLIVS